MQLLKAPGDGHLSGCPGPLEAAGAAGSSHGGEPQTRGRCRPMGGSAPRCPDP